MLILISDTFDAELEKKLPDIGEVTKDKKRLPEADILLVRSKTKCTREYLEAAPNLKLIIRGGVGTDNIDGEFAASRGISVKNTPQASSIAVAETAFAMMLTTSSRIIEAHTSMQKKQWLKQQLKWTELYGKTICLIGMGRIAIEIAKRAAAFGMKVTAFRQSGRPSKYADIKTTLQEAVREADYISLHTPLTNSTRGIINKAVLAVMKKGAVLINTGRAACVVAEDVSAALKSGHLKAYCTDVWVSDPPAPDYPILKSPNVIMTPHIGANSEENSLRISEEVFVIAKEFIEGKENA
ncbi:MAG: NAD(P)-dependent oxidoreductase [Desulfobacterales bacterium]|nr:NAD(P)-dependent oxidoreductase [Desulfobacterales bacterium]